MRQNPERLVCLDALRGVAALAVVIDHAGTGALPHLAPLWTFLGMCGVTIFFLISGYLVVAAYERSSSTLAYSIRRACRIFPLYWVALLAAVLIHAYVGPGAWLPLPISPEVTTYFQSDPVGMVLWHVPLWNYYAGVPRLLGVTWSLGVEEAFYVLVVVLAVTRLLNRPLVVAVLLAAGVVLLDPSWRLPWATYLSLLWLGRLIYLVHTGQMARRVGGLAIAAVTVLVSLPLRTADPAYLLAPGAAVALFVLALRWQHVPSLLVWLGTISYSLYLSHPLLLAILPHPATFPLSLVLFPILLLGLAAVTERYIEQPGIALGRQLSDTPDVVAYNPAQRLDNRHGRRIRWAGRVDVRG